MEISPALIFIIIFILAPLIERILKAGRPPQQPPQGGLPRERPQQFPHQRQRQGPPEEQQPEREVSAAEMLPDDLWEILTGEKRQRPSTPEPAAPEAGTEEAARRPLPYEVEPTPPPARRPAPTPQPQARSRPQQDVPAPRGPRPQKRTPPRDETRRLPGVETRARRLPPVPMRGAPMPAPEERRRAVRPGSAADDLVRKIPVHEAPQVVSLEALEIDDELRHSRFHERLAGMDAPAVVRRPAIHAIARELRDENALRRAIVLNEILGPPKSLE